LIGGPVGQTAFVQQPDESGREHDRQRRGEYEPPFDPSLQIGLARSCHRKAASGEEVGANAEQSRSPEQQGLPSFGLGKSAPETDPRRKPVVESPVDENERKIESLVVLIHQADAELASLVVHEQKVGCDRDHADRQPHRGKHSAEFAIVRQAGEKSDQQQRCVDLDAEETQLR